MAYVTEWARLCEVLDQIDMVFFPFPQDVPLQTADVHALKSTLENTSKHVIVQPYSLESLESLFELAVVAAGGEKALRKRPLISMVSTSLPPFQFKPMDVEAIVLATRYGVPIYAASLPSIGATSPATIFGTVLQNGIEVLASLVMSQLIFPGTPFIGNPVAFTMDMSSGRNVIASIEAELCQAACTQFVKEAYRIPTAPFGFATDSVVPDGQSMLNRSLLGFLVATAGADILAEAGHLEAGLVSSPVQLVLDDMLSSMLRRAAAETKVDDDALAVKEVFETLPGGHYLDRAHTLRHCRDALRSGLLVNQTRMDWVDAGSKDLSDRAADRYRELKYDMHPSEMPPEVRKELAIIAKNADSRLAR
jgi:trimethylamine:corrinoid methyltransferase-like protein